MPFFPVRSVPFREESHRVGISGLYRRLRDRSVIDLEAQAPSTSAGALPETGTQSGTYIAVV
jgi:hypothetical protein